MESLQPTTFNWDKAKQTSLEASAQNLAVFLKVNGGKAFYGFGFFADSYQGSVFLVANTVSYHISSFAAYASMHAVHQSQTGEQSALYDEETFKWDIGNWQFPGGLFPSTSRDQKYFDEQWEPFGRLFVKLGEEQNQVELEGMCGCVLDLLYKAGVFKAVRSMEGFTVLGPDETPESVLRKKRLCDFISRWLVVKPESS